MSTGERPITVCFVGNPNCGKTTLFNAFTGAKLKVANWPFHADSLRQCRIYHRYRFR